MAYAITLTVVGLVCVIFYWQLEIRCDHKFRGPFEDKEGQYIRCFKCAKRIKIDL